MEIPLLILLGGCVVLLFGWLALIEWRYQRLARSFGALMRAGDGTTLEGVLLDHVTRVEQVEQVVNLLESKQPYQVQHVGVVRFNPFADKGGDQSFVVALLDDHTDGFVLSCLQGRVEQRLYAKPVIGGQSTYALTAEEKQAIARAMKPRA